MILSPSPLLDAMTKGLNLWSFRHGGWVVNSEVVTSGIMERERKVKSVVIYANAQGLVVR